MNRIDQGRLDKRKASDIGTRPVSSLRRLTAAGRPGLRAEAGNDPYGPPLALPARPRSEGGKPSRADASGQPVPTLDDPVRKRLPLPAPDARSAEMPVTTELPGIPDVVAPGKKGGKRNRPRKVKGNRGVDTLLRNSYRAQLDMLALAATKANIMISLNGLLMSLMMLSGAHFLSINPLNVIPMSLFLLGCATATVFAVLAARPEVSQRTFEQADFESDEARLLVFEEFSDLQETQYIDAMSRMLRDPGRVYRSMLAHLHDLGKTADRKFQRLYYSYTVFMIGFVLAAISLIVVQMLALSTASV